MGIDEGCYISKTFDDEQKFVSKLNPHLVKKAKLKNIWRISLVIFIIFCFGSIILFSLKLGGVLASNFFSFIALFIGFAALITAETLDNKISLENKAISSIRMEYFIHAKLSNFERLSSTRRKVK